MNIGKSIKHIRKMKGLNQKEFADLYGFNKAYISGVETGKQNPTIKMLEKMAKSFGVPLPVMFWFTFTEEDVEDSKKEAFKVIKPSIDSMIDELFKD